MKDSNKFTTIKVIGDNVFYLKLESIATKKTMQQIVNELVKKELEEKYKNFKLKNVRLDE